MAVGIFAVPDDKLFQNSAILRLTQLGKNAYKLGKKYP